MQTRTACYGLTPYLAFLLFSVSLGPLLFGYHLAELNAPQDVLTCRKTSIASSPDSSTDRSLSSGVDSLPSCIPMNPMEIGVVTSAFTLGGFLGAAFAGPFSSRNGLVKPLVIASLIGACGAALESLAVNIPILAAGRWLSGLAAGTAVVVSPLYIADLAPPEHKALYGCGTQVMVNLGIFLAQLLGYFFSYDQLWRLVLFFPSVVAFLHFLALLFTTESPKKLISLRAVDRGAVTTLMRTIRGPKADIETEIDSWKLGGMENSSDPEHHTLLSSDAPAFATPPGRTQSNTQMSMVQTLCDPVTRPAIVAVVIVMFAQQLCGINSIIMYGVSLLSTLLKSSSSLLNLFVSVLNIAVTVGCAPLPDRLGRKRCILYSIAGMGTSSLLLAISISNSIKLLSVVSVITFVASFALGLGPVPFILASELVGPEAVGATQSWALCVNWLATFLVAQFLPIVNEKLGSGHVYFLFAFMAVLFSVLISRRVPETMGKVDLSDIWQGYSSSSVREE